MAKVLHFVLLLALVCGPVALAQTVGADDTAITTVAPETPNSTTTTSTTSTTTEPPTTSTEKTSTTTTTTEASTTSTTTEKTTTASTSTTTHAPPGPPAPVPEPQANHWVVKNDTKFCLIVDMAIQVNFTYHTTDGANKTALFDVPTTGKVTEGKCASNETSMTVEAADTSKFMLKFALNETSKQYKMDMVMQINVTQDMYPGAAAQIITLMLTYGESVPQGKSYHCNRQQVLNGTEMIDGDNGIIFPATVTMSKAQWQAFHDRQTDGYDLAKDCDAIDTPDIVPIAVGCALAGLVVIVLLGYLVGRRRSQNRGGYLSM